jgi:RND family efflux transporter MFP subunit
MGIVAIISAAGYFGFRSSPEQVDVIPEAPPTIPVTICDVEQTITAPGELINKNEAHIEMPFTGRLASVYVEAGDAVKTGDVLARIDNQEDYEAAVAAANLEVLKAKAAMDELLASAPLETAEARLALVEAQSALAEAQKDRTRLDYPRASAATIDEAKARLALAENMLEIAQTEYNNLSELPFEDPLRAAARLRLSAAQREYDNALATVNWYLGKSNEGEIALADAELALAQARLDQAQAAWEALQTGEQSLAFTLSEAQLTDAQAKLAIAEQALSQLTIKAPFDGVILESSAVAGETIPANSSIFTLNDPQAVEVETTVIEEDLPYVEVGQPAQVYFDALPEETIGGTISRIVPKRAPGDRPLYYVYILLDHVPPKLLAGMSADASITIAGKENVLCLPRAVAQVAADGTSTVEVWNGMAKEKRVIEVGLRGDTNVEVLTGLQEGELVVAK